MQRVLGYSVLFLALTACGGSTPFARTFPQDERRDLSEILRSVKPVKREERPVLVGLTEAPVRLFAWDLENASPLWQHSVQALSAPRAAGTVVFMQEAKGVVARDLDSGDELFRVDEGVKLVGADGTQDMAVMTLALEAEEEEDSLGLLVAVRNGAIAWERELELAVGVPAVVGKYVLVPWGTHRVSVVDAGDGKELARMRLADSVAGHAFVDRGVAYVGQHGFFRVTPQMEAGTKEGAVYYSPLARPLPAQPGLLRESYEPVPPPEHASHRVNLNWSVGGEGEDIHLEDGILYLLFYRFIFALDADSDSILWVYQGPEDIVGSAVQPGGIYVVNAAGKILFLTAMGHPVWESQMNLRPAVAQIRPGHMRAAANARHAGAESAGDQESSRQQASQPPAGQEQLSLQQQLMAASQLDDPRLAAGRAFALEHLSHFDNEAVTAHLLETCDQSKAPEPVRLLACSKLQERNTGQQHLLAALERRASFIDHTSPPPVGVLARAAKFMRLRPAAKLLILHLQDPATPARDLADVLEAIAAVSTIGDRSVSMPVERFVRLHHAEPREEYLAQALQAGVRALAHLRGSGAEPLLQRIAADPMSMPGLPDVAAQVMAELKAPPAAKPDKAEPGEAPATGPSQAAAEEAKPAESAKPDAEPEPRPRYLSMGIVADVMRPAEARFRKCFALDEKKSLSARISMVVHGDGQIEGVFVTPPSMQECVEAVLREYRFPATSKGRQQVAHVVHRIKKEADRPKKAKRPRRAGARARPKIASKE